MGILTVNYSNFFNNAHKILPVAFSSRYRCKWKTGRRLENGKNNSDGTCRAGRRILRLYDFSCSIIRMFYLISSVSRRCFNKPIPEVKKMRPRMAIAHGLRLTRFRPKIPITPRTRPINPAIVNMNANALIIICICHSSKKIIPASRRPAFCILNAFRML
jgi:hypothetical protein